MSQQMGREEALEMLEEQQEMIDRHGRRMAKILQRLTALEEENEQLRDRVAELEARVDPDPTSKEYDEMDRSERIHVLRVAVASKAADGNGKANYCYSDTKARFNERPSDGYTYKLMELAAEADGFEYGSWNGTKQLRVRLDAVSDERVLHAVKNRDGGETDA